MWNIMEIKLFNSLSRSNEKFKPLKDNLVRMYSCGPTVYNYAHIGNMRAFLFADLLQRVIRVVGDCEVQWVMNITNIDDKTIRDSSAHSDAWLTDMGEQTDDPMLNLSNLTKYYELSFFDDISKLGINLNDFYAMPRATDYIEQMLELVRKIYDRGLAYISEGSIYFNVAEWRKIDVYGKLFKIDFENFKAGTRIDSDQYEREQASDFALWKARKPGEPYWKFELDCVCCDGRPGWHLECSAMEAEILGLPFDIHTGGVDLKFPHHEDEIAQSKAGYGVEPTAFWCHNEFLEVEGQKMSKSLGNFFTLRDLMEKGVDPLDIRFAMFSAHYASTYNFTFDGLKSARKARFRVQDYIYELFNSEHFGNEIISVQELKNNVFSALGDDLHTPKALASLFTFINNNPSEKLDNSVRTGLIEFFTDLNKIFDVWELAPRKEEQIIIPQEVIDLADSRLQARNEKNWAESDRLRQLINDAGWTIKDAKDSYTIEKMEE
jgi:cysteinyl-tRNA synthetase